MSKRWLALSIIMVGILLTNGCTIGSPTSPVSSSSPSEEKMPVAVYYPVFNDSDSYLVREVHFIEKSGDPIKAALNELIEGEPSTDGAMRVIPPDTKVLGVEVSSGEAKVNFSRAVLDANVGSALEALGITSIVNTLCEFPSIEKVSFLVEGNVDEEAMDWWGHVGLYEQPFSANWDLVMKPAVWVTSPYYKEEIQSPVTIKGKAMVFEAALSGRIKDQEGKVIAEGNAMATAGAPQRGDFELTLTFNVPSPQEGTIEIYTLSPKDGSEVMEATVPVILK